MGATLENLDGVGGSVVALVGDLDGAVVAVYDEAGYLDGVAGDFCDTVDTCDRNIFQGGKDNRLHIRLNVKEVTRIVPATITDTWMHILEGDQMVCLEVLIIITSLPSNMIRHLCVRFWNESFLSRTNSVLNPRYKEDSQFDFICDWS